MSSSRPWLLVLLVLVAGVGLIALAFRVDDRLGRIEEQMLDRAPTAPPLRLVPRVPSQVASEGAIYVPVYSHVYGKGGKQVPLEVTLSVRNTDSGSEIVVKAVHYYGTEGQLLREYLQSPILLGPMASTDFLVERRDMSGGTGANFLVEWVSEEAVSEPVVEAVMMGSEGNRTFAFTSVGRAVVTPGSETSSEDGD